MPTLIDDDFFSLMLIRLLIRHDCRFRAFLSFLRHADAPRHADILRHFLLI